MTVTWLDGIGPPLEQLREDCEGGSGLDARDGLALIAEVIRLRAFTTESALKRTTPECTCFWLLVDGQQSYRHSLGCPAGCLPVTQEEGK